MTTMSMMNPFCLKLIQSIFLMCLVLQANRICSKEVVRCIQSERQALLQFKAGLIDPFDMLSSWTTEDCCQWYGIGCNNLTGHVLMLNLHGDYNEYHYNDGNKFYISGDIHESLMELQQLKYLNLSGNDFEGNYIPGFFGSLRNLRYLDLSYSNFGGQIPIQFESLSYLKHLSLSLSNLHGWIPHQLGDLFNLQFLDLSNNDFEGSIPTKLGNLSNLEYLDLHGNSFKGKIPSQLGNLFNMQFLDLSYNNHLEGSIPSQLGKLTNLQELYLGGYDNSGLTMDYEDHSRGQWLSNFTSLTHLHMSSISNLYRFNSWLETVGKLPKLVELSLRSCGLSDHFIHSLSQTKFKFSTSVSILDLSRNNFVSSLIFHWVSNINSNLVELDLSGNQMVDLPSNNFSRSLPKLRELRLSDNKFTSFMIIKWVSNISPNLVMLDLSNNQMVDLPSNHFSYRLPKLRELRISHNKFTSFMIFQWVSNISFNLVELDLSNNKLKGVAFKSFMNLCALRYLDIEENNLTEDLQLIIHNLSSGCVRNSLQVLNLGYNGITGTLPDLSVFTSLKTLDLSYNKLSGKIPEGSSLPFQLEQLYITSNSLEGGIPKSFWMNACKLKLLDLSNNRFSGDLQVIVHHLSRCARFSLQHLNLRFNQINGTLPDLSIFSFLESFDISENRLNGKIFEDIRFPTTLRALLMGSNSLNGVISDFHFSGMSMLRYLYLSDNLLTLRFTENWVPPFQLYTMELGSCKLGLTFPKWIQTQKYLKDLDISNGGISDSVPEWFWAKLSSEECYNINVSNNNLRGVIPNLQVKNHCSFLSLSSNEFEGSIPPFLRGSASINLSKNKFSDSHPFLCANGIDATLGQFDLLNNKFSGGIPNCWTNFKSLVYLDLSHNNFSGKIPTSMGYLVELQALILRNNILTEEIPFSLMKCTKLVMLDLRDNRLKGLIPYWIGSELKELQVLSLQRNQFFGSLPLELCHLQSIQLFDLSLNNLSGRIPKCIKNLTSMTEKTSSHGFTNHYYILA